MSLTQFPNTSGGINLDLSPEELPANTPGVAMAWNGSTQNMRFADGYAARFRGFSQIFGDPVVTPYFLTPYATATARYWVHCGVAKVYADDGAARTDITGAAPTGAIDDRWTGGSLNGVLVLNNGVDKPMYWGGTGTLATLPGWGATWKAHSIRPFKNFLIALRITKGATLYPHMVKWSDIAVPGAIPTSWDEANPALDAGENDLAETPDLLVDGLPLGDSFIVYKERSMYAMTYVGAPYIFRFQRLPGESGILARGCVVDTPLGHVVLTAGDVVLNAGQGPVSIANAQVRNYIFTTINSTLYQRAFVCKNPQKNEVWVCFPTADSTVCNVAAVWNWVDRTWAVRTLTGATYGAHGQVPTGSGADTWGSDGSPWDTDDSAWTENEYSPAEARLLLTHSTPKISLADSGTLDLGAPITAVLERTGMALDDANLVKTVRNVLPRIDGPSGQVIQVQVGASMLPDVAPTYSAPVNFTVGESRQVDCFATGRFLAIRFSSGGYPRWRMRSFDVAYEDVGLY